MQLPSMIGRSLGRYRILAKMGAGGMGEVYTARDDRLERDIALKILTAGTLSDEAARKRFRQEALALSKLNNPNIATIYDFDTADGMDFIAMELVDGETLAQKARGAALTEKEVVALGGQIADALEEAHEHGIVHRDLKPSNVMVTPRGRAKVLDFGLAKLLHPGGSVTSAVTLSETQGIAGTLPYMAPEQLQGEPLDPRGDIFSLGAVLYELATGQRPFPELNSSRLIDAILRQPPVQPRALNPRLSSEFERIILKCLEKQPELRYQSAKELSVDLRRLSAPTVTSAVSAAALPHAHARKRALAWVLAAIVLLAILAVFYFGRGRSALPSVTQSAKVESLAVLPLANISADPAQEYFADGMTEELTTELAQISGLRVISRTSTARYKGTKKALPEIAKELNVDAVIEGSVERSGDDVRITAQLINARTDTHLWAHSYQRNLRDVLAIQEEVARAIAGEIQVQLTPQEQKRFERSRPVDPAAQEAYLLGLYHNEFHTAPELQKAITEYQRAIQLDPGYALAYVGLSDTYHILPFNADAAPQEVLPRAKDAALKALELDPDLGSAHSALARILGQYDWDWAGAEREYKRAIELAPNSAVSYYSYSEMLSVLSRQPEAIAAAGRARQLDPVSVPARFLLGRSYFYAGQDDRALEQFHESIESNTNFWPVHLFFGEMLANQKKYPEAIAELQKGQGTTLQAKSTMGYVYGVWGKKAEAQQILNELLLRSKASYVPPTYLARVYMGLDQKDKAFEWLEKGYAVRDSHIEFLASDPLYASLRSDSRCTDLLRRLGLPH
jgi:TolB-like protein/Flp pilus assembly protein TadD/predicted Ser/Thr protein kinase